MADNTDDQHVDNTTGTQSENPSDKIIPSKDTKTINANKETKNMETHAHDLHKAPGHGWKHYAFEFLMLFLAVFCGFIAENRREHIVEHEREKQYMYSLLSDLSADTTSIANGIPLKQRRINAVDSVFRFFNSHPDAKTISGKLFRTIRRSSSDYRFIRNDITINQLKYSGGMRMIGNKKVADSISAYDLRYESIISLYNELYLANVQLANRQCEKLFEAKDLLPLYIANTDPAIVANIPDSLSIGINTSELNQQLNFMMQEKAYAKQETDRYNDLKARAERLMELIKKQYNLE
jgi:hypothetical protein